MQTGIRINDDLYLTKSARSDQPDLIRYLNDEELFHQTLRVPNPYTEQDAENWFNYILSFESENTIRKNWVIRNSRGALMGHVGLHFTHGLESETVEIYYWLGRPFRNQGIITEVVTYFSDYCFSTLNYRRIEAPIFDFNTASERVLKKCGYTFEGHLPAHYTKAGKTIGANMYVKTRDF